MIGEGPTWRAWLPAASETDRRPTDTAPSLLAQFRDDDVRVTLSVGELLLPNIPPGRLDARFTLVDDTLDVAEARLRRRRRAAHSPATAVSSSVSEAALGPRRFRLRAATTDSLRIASELARAAGGREQVEASFEPRAARHQGGLVATREGDATKAVLEIGRQGRRLASRAHRPRHRRADTLAEAEIDLDGSVTGERPQALLVLLFPEPSAGPHCRAPGGSQGTLSVEAHRRAERQA